MPSASDVFTVYILEDDASVRTGLSRLMRASGIAAKAFAMPEDFFNEVSAASKGCVLLDITMPQMSGLQVQARLRDEGIPMPVIALSASESSDVRESARALGAQFFLHKPVDDQALLDAIEWVSDSEHHGNERTSTPA